MAQNVDLTKFEFSGKGILMLGIALFFLALLVALVSPAGRMVGEKIVGVAEGVREGVTQENKQASAQSNSPFPGAR